MKRVHILGAGPTGLALAQELAERTSDLSVVVYERSTNLGGMAQTVQWAGYGAHDLGPHKIFTVDRALWQRVRGLLREEDWLTQPKRSRIYLGGHFLPYPPSPFAMARVFGPVAFVQMTFGFLKARFFPRSTSETFEGDLRARVGDALFERLFLPIALKLWGAPNTLDAKLSRGRVQTPGIAEVILRILRIKKSSQFEALQFDYPRHGLSRLWDAIVARTVQRRVEFRTGTEVRQVQIEGNRVRRLVVASNGNESAIDLESEDFVFSTLPVLRLLECTDGVSPRIHQLARATVRLNDLVLVFLKLDVQELFEDSWIFVPDAGISFHRVSEQKSFDPDMTPNGTIVCCEIMSHAERSLSACSDAELESLAVEDLRRMAPRAFQVQAARVIRLPASYPVYLTGFAPKLEELIGYFDGLENFRTIGRAGAFNYIGTLDCMDIGYGAGRWYVDDHLRGNAASWRAERLRTSHYPVLD
ncbi:MAG: NAD(P)-binding protein [Opitutae bacterium]|nr:NAD(P)-binding protein [Opitutae bacterium]